MEDGIAELKVGQAEMRGEVAVLRTQQDANHKENRKDIAILTLSAQETASKLGTIEGLVQQGVGAAKFGTAVVTLLGVAWVIIQIKQAVMGH